MGDGEFFFKGDPFVGLAFFVGALSEFIGCCPSLSLTVFVRAPDKTTGMTVMVFLDIVPKSKGRGSMAILTTNSQKVLYRGLFFSPTKFFLNCRDVLALNGSYHFIA